MSRCVLLGLQTSMASMSLRAISFRQSDSVLSHPHRSAKGLSFSALRAQAALSTGRRSRSKNWLTLRYAFEWARPMKP